MINDFLNLFRKKKVRIYKPRASCSGPIVAATEFVQFKSVYEQASGKKIRLVKSYNVFGFERIAYVEED